MKKVLGLALMVGLVGLGGCKDDDTGAGGTTTGSGGGGGGTSEGGGGALPTEGATVALDCIDEGAACDPPETYQATVAATQLDSCNYWDGTKSFKVRFVGTMAEINVAIAGFTGSGSHTTSADGATNVTMSGVGNIPSDADAAGPPEHPCTLDVESNLADIQIPATGEAPLLDVALDISCPTLIAGGVCDVICTPTPSTFRLSVGGCVVAN